MTPEQTITTAAPAPANRATIAGVLLPDLACPQRSSLGAPVTQIQLQVLTPFGEPFALPVQLAGEAEQQFRLRRGQARNLVVTGQVRLREQYDGRYARPQDVLGERVQRMELVAESVRPLSPEETVGASIVELEGTVSGHPIRREHPHQPTRDVLEVTLACSVPHTVTLGDQTLSRTLRYRVRLAVPRRARGARYLYVPGNRVLIRGELDCVLVRWMPDGADGSSAFQQAQHSWEQAQRRYRHSPQRLAQEREKFFRAIRNLELTPRWHVLVGEVVPRRDAIRVREALTSGARRGRPQLRTKRGESREVRPREEQAVGAPVEEVAQPVVEVDRAIGEEVSALDDAAGTEPAPLALPEEPAVSASQDEVQAAVEP
jgi:hypothetical protein